METRHYMKDYKYWNKIKNKPAECDCEASPEDIVYYDGGILYLVQKKNDSNNVVCFRLKNCKTTVKQSFYHFRRFCVNHHIQYIRVEGNQRRYFFLKMFEKGLKGQGYSVVQDLKAREEKKRNIFYIKLYK